MRVYLGGVLKECGGKIYGKGGAAERLKLKPTTLQSKLIKYGVER
jgi:transcriptional regulator with GAF, ATPase, and Fis domain